MAKKLLTIRGLRETERALKRLDRKIRNKVVRQALRRAAKPLAAELRSKAPEGETGQNKAAIKTRAARSRKRGYIGVNVGAGDRNAPNFALQFYEFGTSHQPARPIFAETLDEMGTALLALMEKEIQRGLREVSWVGRAANSKGAKALRKKTARLKKRAGRSIKRTKRRASKSIRRGRKTLKRTRKNVVKRSRKAVKQARRTLRRRRR